MAMASIAIDVRKRTSSDLNNEVQAPKRRSLEKRSPAVQPSPSSSAAAADGEPRQQQQQQQQQRTQTGTSGAAPGTWPYMMPPFMPPFCFMPPFMMAPFMMAGMSPFNMQQMGSAPFAWGPNAAWGSSGMQGTQGAWPTWSQQSAQQYQQQLQANLLAPSTSSAPVKTTAATAAPSSSSAPAEVQGDATAALETLEAIEFESFIDSFLDCGRSNDDPLGLPLVLSSSCLSGPASGKTGEDEPQPLNIKLSSDSTLVDLDLDLIATGGDIDLSIC